MLVLVRHGESQGNADGLLLGRLESPLTERGRCQARSLGAFLASGVVPGGVTRLVSSPLGRARQTALGLGLPVVASVDERWAEVDYGEFDGQKLTDVPAEVWRRWRADPSFEPPGGGESLVALGTRVREACDELFAVSGEGARRDDGDVVVVSHVSPIKAAVAWALGTDDAVAWRLYLATGSVTIIGWGAGGPVLRGYNLVPPG